MVATCLLYFSYFRPGLCYFVIMKHLWADHTFFMLRSPHFTSSTNVPPSSIPPVATTWSNLFQGAALSSFRSLGKLCSLQPYQRLWKGIENCLRNLIGGIPPSTLLLNIYLFYFFIYLYLFKKHKESVFQSKNWPLPHPPSKCLWSPFKYCRLWVEQASINFGLRAAIMWLPS